MMAETTSKVIKQIGELLKDDVTLSKITFKTPVTQGIIWINIKFMCTYITQTTSVNLCQSKSRQEDNKEQRHFYLLPWSRNYFMVWSMMQAQVLYVIPNSRWEVNIGCGGSLLSDGVNQECRANHVFTLYAKGGFILWETSPQRPHWWSTYESEIEGKRLTNL